MVVIILLTVMVFYTIHITFLLTTVKPFVDYHSRKFRFCLLCHSVVSSSPNVVRYYYYCRVRQIGFGICNMALLAANTLHRMPDTVDVFYSLFHRNQTFDVVDTLFQIEHPLEERNCSGGCHYYLCLCRHDYS